MAGIADVFVYFLVYYWWLFLTIALIFTGMIALLIVTALRRILNRVMYIRGGRSFEYKSCHVIGTNIKFKPNPQQKPLTVPIVSDPYIQYGGLFAKRVYIVVEGSGQTSRFPDGVNGPATQLDNIVRTYVDKKTGDRYTRKVEERRIIQNVPAVGAQNPQLTVASSSISYFERGVDSLTASLPKTAASLFMNIVFLIIGLLGGIAWGHLLIH